MEKLSHPMSKDPSVVVGGPGIIGLEEVSVCCWGLVWWHSMKGGPLPCALFIFIIMHKPSRTTCLKDPDSLVGLF